MFFAEIEGELDAYDRYWDVVRVELTRIADSLAAGEFDSLATDHAGQIIGLADAPEIQNYERED